MKSEARQQLDEATQREWLWKTPAMQKMALAVCELAINSQEFSANDLPEFEHGGRGICGSIFRRLAADGVIVPVMIGTQQKIAYNAGGNRIGVYKVASHKLTLRLIQVHGGKATESKQLELIT